MFADRLSHLTRGAWIEITMQTYNQNIENGRTSHEVRGLKLRCLYQLGTYCLRRTSHEVRGLKFCSAGTTSTASAGRTSHEVRGLKYEKENPHVHLIFVAPHTRCVD